MMETEMALLKCGFGVWVDLEVAWAYTFRVVRDGETWADTIETVSFGGIAHDDVGFELFGDILEGIGEPFVGIEFSFGVDLLIFFVFQDEVEELVGIELVLGGVLGCGLVVGLEFAFKVIVEIDADGFGGFLGLFFVTKYSTD